jgi:hypothetical protein
LIALIINAHPRPFVVGILGEFPQQDMDTDDCPDANSSFAPIEHRLERPFLLQDRSDGKAVKLYRHERAQSPPMDDGKDQTRH